MCVCVCVCVCVQICMCTHAYFVHMLVSAFVLYIRGCAHVNANAYDYETSIFDT